MSLPIKSVLRALKRDLERVALMAIGEIRLFMRSHLLKHDFKLFLLATSI